jgi:cytochrome P450
MSVDYDPFSEEAMRDPYPLYRRLRAESPIHYIESFDAWALARFEDVWTASMDDANLTATRGTTTPYLLTRVLAPIANLAHMDPPAHRALRSELAPFYLPRRVRSLEPVVRRLVAECIDRFADAGVADVVEELAQIVAARVACIASGFPESDAEYLSGLVKRTVARPEGVVGMSEDGRAAFAEKEAYLGRLARERRAHAGPPENPLDVYLHAQIDGVPLDEASLAQHLILFVNGGTDTLPKAFASAVLQLWRHPDQRREVAADPGLLAQAVRESLRFDTPTHFMMRSVVCSFELGGRKLKPGQPVLLLHASANRDEREFDAPDRFDIHRKPLRFLSFGTGTHRCLGAHVAELQLRVMLEELLRRFPDYEVDLSDAQRARSEFIQGYTRLPVHFQRRARSGAVGSV